MNRKEVEVKIRTAVSSGQELLKKIRTDYAKSDNLVSFVKQTFTEEILNRKERIPAAVVTLWLLTVFIFSYDWTFGMNWAMVFNLGVLPFLVYYIIRTIREAPSN